MNPDLLIETQKLARSWAQHQAGWLRDYLVAGVEDPRLNLQSILSRHFLIRSLARDRFEALMQHEYRFAVVMDWLMRVASQPRDDEMLAAILHALQKHSDNAEGVEIPGLVLQTFANLPTPASGCVVPNYIEAFLTRSEQAAEDESKLREGLLNTFSTIWNLALTSQFTGRETKSKRDDAQQDALECLRGHGYPALSLLEPASGSANDYRFIHSFGIARSFDYTGFDLCPKNIQNALALFPGVRFEIGNAFEISAPGKSYDLCIVHDLFEHLSIPGLEQAVREICRVTRRGICVGFFQMDEVPEHVVRPLDDYHWNLLSLRRMKGLFASNGFAAQAIHIGSFLQRQLAWQETHNPHAYTFVLEAA